MQKREFAFIRLMSLFVVLIGNRLGVAADTPPKVGDTAPKFELQSVEGTTIKLADYAGKGPVVLVVLRGFPGYQCPICSQQVGQLLEKAEEIKSAGATVLLVYPGPSAKLIEKAKEFIKDKTIPDHFQLLVDPDYKFTNAYHLRWNASGETAYPTTLIIQPSMKVTFSKVSRSHGGRSTAKEILEKLNSKNEN